MEDKIKKNGTLKKIKSIFMKLVETTPVKKAKIPLSSLEISGE